MAESALVELCNSQLVCHAGFSEVRSASASVSQCEISVLLGVRQHHGELATLKVEARGTEQEAWRTEESGAPAARVLATRYPSGFISIPL